MVDVPVLYVDLDGTDTAHTHLMAASRAAPVMTDTETLAAKVDRLDR